MDVFSKGVYFVRALRLVERDCVSVEAPASYTSVLQLDCAGLSLIDLV